MRDKLENGSRKTKIRFANNSEWIEVTNFDPEKFRKVSSFKDEVFGWYNGSYISVNKNDLEKVD